MNNRDADLAINNAQPQNNEGSAKTLQSDFISQSIKDILDIRENLGITQAQGNNLPLEELFQTYKGTIFDEKS